MRHLMPRFISSVRIALALLMAGLGACVLSSVAGAAPLAVVAAPGDTMLPAGWELCVLQGAAAPATQANVDNLDEWQAAEGGSTNNSAAYNPFNTRRTTDLNNAPLPAVVSSNGFPAFSTWVAGCAATVATLLQPNMWPITAALRAGNVAPPGVFLADVDKSQWCAPSADGTPCYASRIIGATGELAAALLGTSAALSVYTNVQSDVNVYEQAVAASAVDQGVLTSRNQELAAAQAAVAAARSSLAATGRRLRRFAVDEYVSSGLYVSSSFTNVGGPTPFGPPDANGVAAEQYESVTASDLVVALSGSGVSRVGGAVRACCRDRGARPGQLDPGLGHFGREPGPGAAGERRRDPADGGGMHDGATQCAHGQRRDSGGGYRHHHDGAHHHGAHGAADHHGRRRRPCPPRRCRSGDDDDHDDDHRADDGARRRRSTRRRRCPHDGAADDGAFHQRHDDDGAGDARHVRRRPHRACPGSGRSKAAWPSSLPPRPPDPHPVTSREHDGTGRARGRTAEPAGAPRAIGGA